jgi:hypothetical protein
MPSPPTLLSVPPVAVVAPVDEPAEACGTTSSGALMNEQAPISKKAAAMDNEGRRRMLGSAR